MRNFIILLIVVLFIANSIFAATPVIKVPNLEPNETLELFEDSDGLFSIKVMDYYKMALMLETQLNLLGIEPKTKSSAPTYEELDELDMQVIKKYYKMAKSLEKEVLDAPPSDRQVLLEKINNLERTLSENKAQNTIEKGKIANSILEQTLEKLKQQEQIYEKNMELVQEQFLLNCKDYYTLISVAGAGNMFVSNGGNNLRNDPWLSVKTTVNAGRALGFWQDFNVWYEYLSPRFYTEYQHNDFKITEDWNSNAHALGIGGKVPISIKPDFHHGLNLEVGYFWLKGHVYNRPFGNIDWDGFNFNLEYYFGVPSCKYPFELFINMSIYNSFNKNLVINTGYLDYPNVDLGKTHIGLSFGIRYNLLRTPY